MAYPTATEYFTGKEAWSYGMPSSVKPRAVGIEGGDPGFEPGTISTVTRAGAGASGTLSIYSGGPTDTYAVRVEMLSATTFRWRLQTTDSWSATQTIPSSLLYEIPQSGMTLLFTGTFVTGETHDFTTTESAQSATIRRAVCLEMDGYLRTRGTAPLDSDDIGPDLKLLGARLWAWEMLKLRGYDPRSKHDEQIMYSARKSKARLARIREEREQGGWGGQDSTAGVAMDSQDAQGVDLW